MWLRKCKKGQSMLEYALLLGVIIAAVLIMQGFIKEHFQGGLKESAEKMGERFSAGATSTLQQRKMEDSDQEILEETATKAGQGIDNYVDGDLKGTVTQKVYNFSSRTGGNIASTNKQQTEAAKQEKYRWSEYGETAYGDFAPPF